MRRRRRALDGLEEDIRDHIEQETRDNIQRGMAPDKARQSAMRKFGNVALVKEDTRAVWISTGLEQLVEDVRYALRTFRRNPCFNVVVILTLALGIGMNTAVFSIVNAVLLRPLSYPDPERLVWLTRYDRVWNEESVLARELTTWKDATSFERIVPYDFIEMNMPASETAGRGRIALVSDDFWEVAGVQAAVGRLPLPGERDAVVLSDDAFDRWFHRDPGIIGKLMAQSKATITGVLPKDFLFQFPQFSVGSVPMDSDSIEGFSPMAPARFGRVSGVVARLKPGVTVDQAKAELEVIHARGPDGQTEASEEGELRVVPLMDKVVKAPVSRALWILLAAVVFVLLIASANSASLLLARASVRQKEIAVRMALGAGRARLMKQFFIESTLLAMLGGGAGLILAWRAPALILYLIPDSLPRLAETSFDYRVLTFTLLVSILTALIFGMAPALTLRKANLQGTLQESARNVSPAPGSLRARQLLVVAELTLAVVLLTGAGLMVKSFWRMYTHPPGFAPDRILTMKVPLESARYFGVLPRQRAYVDQLLQRIRSMPGVQAASVAKALGGTIVWEGRAPAEFGEESPAVTGRATSAAYPNVLGLRLLKGRWFTDEEPQGVIVINESLARRDFPGQDPLGQRMVNAGTVVGVIADLKYAKLDAEPEPEFYFPYSHMQRLDGLAFLVLTAGNPAPLTQTIRQAAMDIDRTEPLFDAKTMEQVLSESIAPRRFNLFLLVTFATAALVLSVIGIYALIAYWVTQRTHEIGIRLALGAGRGTIVQMVVRQGMLLAAAGVICGVASSLALARVMANLLYGVEPTDPLTLAAVSVLLVLTAVVACCGPAIKGARIDPIIFLRYE